MTAAVGAQKLSAGTWAIDPVHSSINFSVRHLMVGKIHGRFDEFSGAITSTEDGTPSVTAEIDVNSVDTGNEQREAHIKAAISSTSPSSRSRHSCPPQCGPTGTTTCSKAISRSRVSPGRSR